MKEPDFASNERQLIDASILAISEFAAQHTDELFRYFAFDCNADYGEILPCLDTEENSIAQAKKHEARISERRLTQLSYDDKKSLEWAINTFKNPITGPVLPYNNNTGDFRYQGFAEVSFLDEWEEFSLADDYPGEFADSQDDYLECTAAVMFSRTIDALVEQKAFDCLQRTSPFLVGFAFHEGPQLVVRLLNC
ncbi:hypothetical protein RMSM_06681 [Rhodopirellula maiorica SM1]|uniref:Uncharacterized protein n=1 Tax=Rhodopirellula maiorica SM1 TaxID=1265738 RepID=M5RA72_9BACT|nr:hypothetical protein [Rhodopirellula maiorica]EMI16393.1 hypothetical protein RMSM_06681 [Rhodopirellula maiorica SM1]